MKISTRGRYAIRVLIDLAENGAETGYVAMKEVANREGISLKYLEKILPELVKAGLIEGVHGKGGGYRLKRLPEEYNIYEILSLTEGELAPVSCLESSATESERQAEGRTIGMWEKLYQITTDYFKSITIADLMSEEAMREKILMEDFAVYSGL